MGKIASKVFFAAVMGAAYYAYTKRNQISEQLEDEKVIHFINNVKETSTKIINTVSGQVTELTDSMVGKMEDMNVDAQIRDIKSKVAVAVDKINQQVQIALKDDERKVQELEKVREIKAVFVDAPVEEFEDLSTNVYPFENQEEEVNDDGEATIQTTLEETLTVADPQADSFEASIDLVNNNDSFTENINTVEEVKISELLIGEETIVEEEAREAEEISEATVEESVIEDIEEKEVKEVAESYEPALEVEVSEKVVEKKGLFSGIFGSKSKEVELDPVSKYLKKYPTIDEDKVHTIIDQTRNMLESLSGIEEFRLVQTVYFDNEKKKRKFLKDLEDSSYHIHEKDDKHTLEVAIVTVTKQEVVENIILDIVDCTLYNNSQYRGWRVELVN